MNNADLTGIAGEAVELMLFAMFDFVGEPKFWHSGAGIITFGGEDYEGIGALSSVDSIRDSIGYAPSRVRCSFNNPLAAQLNEALNENTWGRLAEFYLGGWTGSGLAAEPTLMLRGRMGVPEVVVGRQNRVSVVVEDIRALLNRVNGKRSTILEHQVEAPGDTFYRWLPKMLDHKFIFNGGTYGAPGTSVPRGAPGTNYDDWGAPSGPVLP